MEYREQRDKKYPFREEGIKLWNPLEKVKGCNNEPIIPISVSDSWRNRSYRIVDTLIKAFRDLKGSISVDRGGKDNINITLLGASISFSLFECKSKRRYLVDQKAEFKPIYEMVFDGRLQLNWHIYKGRYDYYDSAKNPSGSLSYIDSDDNRLENQVPSMIAELYKQCCDNEIAAHLNQKKRILEYQREKEEQKTRDLEEEKQKQEQIRQAHKNSLINDIPSHADNWFKHEQLARYADELEARLATCEDTETIRLLKPYIRLVIEQASKSSPLNHILKKMRTIEPHEDN